MPRALRGDARPAALVCAMLVSGCAIDKGGLGADPLDGAAVVDADVDSATTNSADTGQSMETSADDATPPGSDATDDAGANDAGPRANDASAVGDKGSDAGDEEGADASDAGTNGRKCASVVLTPVGAVSLSAMQSAIYAVDGSFKTRWESIQGVDPQWIYADFGTRVFVNHVQILWENSCGRDYDLQTSNDAATWTTMTSVVGNTLGKVGFPTDWSTAADHPGLSGVGRYMRVYGKARCNAYGYSIWEMRVFGDTSASCEP